MICMITRDGVLVCYVHVSVHNDSAKLVMGKNVALMQLENVC